MRYLYRYRYFLSFFFAFVIGLNVLVGTAFAYNNNRVLDDSVMDNYNSMSAAQIDALLNSKSSCISPNSGFSAIDPVGYNVSQGFLYGGNVSAGKVLYDAAQAYSINPQVLITTLQKEQSLITSTSCSTNTISKAMGYACPDSGGSYSYTGVNLYTRSGTTFTSVSGICVNSAAKAGFTQQVIRAAWLLKYTEQRSQGNIGWAVIKGSWDNSDDLNGTYSGYMTEGCYKRSKYESSCTNYDGWTTIDNTAVHMDTGATAALYRYTPHFSGNQHFLSLFEQTFGFGSTTTDQAQYKGQSGYATLLPGQNNSAVIRYANVSGIPWYDDTTAAAAGAHPVHLAATNPINRSSVFSSTWPSSNRAATTFAHVYEADGTTLATNQHVAQTGQIVEFDFTFSTSASTTTSFYREFFQPVLEGASNWDMGGMAWWDITVQPPTYKATFSWQSGFPTLVKGQSSSAFLRYKNESNVPWYDDTTAATAGVKPIHLATDSPINRGSSLSATWPTNNRAAVTFAHVYESNGTTLATNQHIAQPGQIVEFDFTFSTANVNPGFYRESFRPVVEGASNWDMGGGAWLDVTVQAPSYKASFVGQSGYPTIQKGNSTPAFFKFKNAGNVPWYDDTTAGGAGAKPIHLATGNPINRSSSFGLTWPSANRTDYVFSHVYEADGTTLATNQHVAQPGQIVEFDFTLTIPSNTSVGLHREYFQPIIEGADQWDMNMLAWLDMNVTN